MEEHLRRPETTWNDLAVLAPEASALGLSKRAIDQLVIETKYWGYIRRQGLEVERQSKAQSLKIPAAFNYVAVGGKGCPVSSYNGFNGCLTPSPTFMAPSSGTSTNTLYGPRQLQFSAKIVF